MGKGAAAMEITSVLILGGAYEHAADAEVLELGAQLGKRVPEGETDLSDELHAWHLKKRRKRFSVCSNHHRVLSFLFIPNNNNEC